MGASMPSPIGHVLAGAAIAWTFEAAEGTKPPQAAAPSTNWRFVALCAALAALPDIDLLLMPIHRTMTHSVTAAFAVFIVAAGVTGWVTGRVHWLIAIACGAAYGSHVVMDWLGADASRPYGIQAFWPFSHHWFMSPLPVFPGTERRVPLSARSMWINLKAAAAELAIMGTLAWAAWRARERRRKFRAAASREG
jgi:inner membrane protein